MLRRSSYGFLVLSLLAVAAPGCAVEYAEDGDEQTVGAGSDAETDLSQCVAQTEEDGSETLECPTDPAALTECNIFSTSVAAYFTKLCKSWGHSGAWSANGFPTKSGGCRYRLNECY